MEPNDVYVLIGVDVDSSVWNAIAALAAAVAAVIAAFQLFQLRRDAKRDRQLELAGVSVVTTIEERPRGSRTAGISAVWSYGVEVVNPGRTPITNVRVTVTFPGQVQRLHGDGSVEPAAEKLTFYSPVIAAGGRRPWSRQLSIDGAVSLDIKKTFATVEFTSPDFGDRTNVWRPRSA